MAVETELELWLGTDHAFVFHILNEAETEAVNISGWSLSFMIKRKLTNPDADALVTLTTVSGISIAGTFNSVPGTNTQRATVTITDTATEILVAGLRYWELKRMDAGFETILSFGRMDLRRSVHIA